MRDLLSSHLARLTHSSSSPEAKTSLKSDLMELAKLCQIAPHNDYLLEAVTGPLSPAIKMIFGAASLIVALTEMGRRQVYFAVIAQLQATGQLDELATSEEKRRRLIERFILSSSADLIAAHYGSCPKGFLRVLTRLGDRARPVDLYLDLHKLVANVPGMAQELLSITQKKLLSNDIVEVLMNMPRGAGFVRLAEQFDDVCDYERFINLYQTLTGNQELSEEHRSCLSNGGKPSHLLEALYLDLPFPQPAIAAPGLRHVEDGHELVRVAKIFKNCLSGFVAEALKGEHQYYIWSKKDTPAVVACIQNEAPFGWFLSEMKLAKNERVPGALKRELKSLLEHCGVRTVGSVEDMMRPHRHPIHVDDFEHLFDLDAA
jgi:hypothetical protein